MAGSLKQRRGGSWDWVEMDARGTHVDRQGFRNTNEVRILELPSYHTWQENLVH